MEVAMIISLYVLFYLSGVVAAIRDKEIKKDCDLDNDHYIVFGAVLLLNTTLLVTALYGYDNVIKIHAKIANYIMKLKAKKWRRISEKHKLKYS